MKKNLQQGFTLIELLVVIAIIGILASVVLASLNSARNKGADAAVKANLANLRAQAEIYYDSNSSYGAALNCTVSSAGVIAGTGCPGTGTLIADTTFQNGLKAAASAAGATLYVNTAIASGSTPAAWAAFTTLKTDATKSQCVDSTGAAKTVTTPGTTTITVCP